MLRTSAITAVVVVFLVMSSAAHAQQRNARAAQAQANTIGSFWPASAPARTSDGGSATQPGKTSLLVLRDGNNYETTELELGNGRLTYTLSSGDKKDVDMSEVDWRKTFTANRQRGIMLMIHGMPQ